MRKKEVFDFWDSYYESCSKCDYSWGKFHFEKDKDGKRIHHKCPKCGTLMTELSDEEKEYMYKRM